ncbi:hypothetical protein LCGC14_1402830, partial [marine sediment metagenome]
MTNAKKDSSEESFYQIQKVYLIIIAIEVLIDRTFYRVGTAFIPGKVYDTVMILGNFSRIMMVLLNFTLLGFFMYKNRNHMNKILLIVIIFQTFLFLTSYLLYWLRFEMPIFVSLLSLLIGMLIINFLMIQKIISSEFEGEDRKISIFHNVILVCILLIFDLAMFHEIMFVLHSIFTIPPDFHVIMFIISQVLSFTIFGPLVFILPFTFREKINLKGFVRKIPLIVILIGVISILGFVNSGLIIATEEHPNLIGAPQIFGWSAIYISGFTVIASSMLLLSWSIISLGLLLFGIYFLWIIGKTRKNQSLKQLSYGIFILLCSAFMFVG